MEIIADALVFLSTLYLKGIHADALPYLYETPEFAVHLPLPKNIPTTQQTDQWAAEHYQLFGMNVYPYASAFLEPDGMLGGPVTESVLHFYQSGGFTPPTQSEAPDHIAHELLFLAHCGTLAAKAAEGQNGASQKQIVQIHLLQTRFLQEHLTLWLPVFTHAIIRQGNRFYATLAELTLDLVNTYAQLLSATRLEIQPILPIPPRAGLLENPETRLRDIARFLLTPFDSGLYLSRETIAHLGRTTRLPRGFGDRTQILSNLFHSAVDYDQLPEVLNLLDAEIGDWLAYYEHLKNEYPTMAFSANFWRARVQTARNITGEMHKELVNSRERSKK